MATRSSTYPAPVSRRNVLAGGAATALVILTGSVEAIAAAREQTLIIKSTAIAVQNASPPLQFDLFYDLSRYITARSKLDTKTAQLYFERFEREQWAWTRAAQLYALIQKALSEGIASAPELLASGQLDDKDQWFAQRILNVWYEGNYQFEGKVVRLTYEDALMWEIVTDLLPIQGLSNKQYGYWSRPPQPKDEQ